MLWALRHLEQALETRELMTALLRRWLRTAESPYATYVSREL